MNQPLQKRFYAFYKSAYIAAGNDYGNTFILDFIYYWTTESTGIMKFEKELEFRMNQRMKEFYEKNMDLDKNNIFKNL